MSRTADVLMEAQRLREDRDRKLRSALTVGELRAILDNITTDRDNVPVVVPVKITTAIVEAWHNGRMGQFSPVTDWRGEHWPGSMIADGNVLALYLGE